MARERKSLIEARERLRLTRPQLAGKMGRARSYIFRVETGDAHPGLATILDWLAVLGPGASVEMFLPHPRVAIWSRLLAEKSRPADQQLVA